jgi:hypothetical protein
MRKLLGPSLLFCFLSPLVAPLTAEQRPNACPTHITSCGCVITSTGTYVVDNNLNASQSSAPNCIEIAADHTVLNLKGLEMQGNGTGIGILIRHSADHTVVQGGDEGSGPDGPGRIQNSLYQAAGDQASIFMWNIAIEDDADYAVIELFRQLGGNKFQITEGNNTGLFFNGVSGSIAGDFDASYNLVAGVIATNSSRLNLFNFSATGPNPDAGSKNIQPLGVMLDNTNESTIGTASMADNAVYGLWLARSSKNVILDSNGTARNQDTGILIGCGSLHCTGNQRSDDNRVTTGGAKDNVNYGIVIENKNHNNVISVTHNDGNGKTDMVDLNNKCDSNIWYNNTGTSNQNCIH